MPPSQVNNRSKNETDGPSREVLDKIVLLLVSGLSQSAVEEAAVKLGLAGDAVASAIAESRTRIQIASLWDRREQLGTALVRLNDIYRRALAVQDAKTALAVQKELNRLFDLYQPPKPVENTNADRTAAESSFAAAIAEARSHLAPLGLGDENTPLAELCRLAVLRIISDGERERSIPPTPRADGRGPKRAGPARPRNRSDTSD